MATKNSKWKQKRHLARLERRRHRDITRLQREEYASPRTSADNAPESTYGIWALLFMWDKKAYRQRVCPKILIPPKPLRPWETRGDR